jgi:type I restriction enzyme, S subunit
VSHSVWPPYKLGDFLEVKHGFAFRGEFFGDVGAHIILTPGNFYDEGGFKHKGAGEKRYSGPVPAEYILHKGDVVVAMTEQAEGLLGSSAIVPRGELYLHNQRIGLLRFEDSNSSDSRFFYYLFNCPWVRRQIRASATGAKIRHTAPGRIAEVKVYVPDLSEQRRIASLLSAYDGLISNNLRRIEILEEVARSIYREWFVYFRFPGHERVGLVDSSLGPVPSGWSVAAFTDVADVLSGGTPKTDIAEYWGGDIPFFTPRDAPNSYYVHHTEKTITDAGLQKCASEQYPAETIFITARGTVGKIALAGVPMAMNQSCYAVRGRDGVPQRLLFQLLREQISHLKTNTGGATFDTIIVDTFRRMLVLRPSRIVMDLYAARTDSMYLQIELLQRQIRNLRATRDFLLPRLMSGQLTLPEVEEAVPASL